MALTQIKAAGIAADAIDETKIADNGIDSEHYNDGSIDHEHLANDAVDADILADNCVGLAALAHGTDGNLITYDANGAPDVVGTGSSGQVLTSNGAGAAPTFQAAGGTTINNNADNRVITGSGTSGTLEGESTLTYDGAGALAITGNSSGDGLSITNDGDHYTQITMDADRSSASNALGIIQGKWNNNSVASIYLRSGADTSNKDDGEITFSTSAAGASEAVRMTVENNGNVTIEDGNLVFGTAAHGIDFSVQNASSESGVTVEDEVLDHYEKGTWTPFFFGSTTAGTFSVSVRPARYVRIGDLVWINMYIQGGSLSGAAGDLKIGGLPYHIEGSPDCAMTVAYANGFSEMPDNTVLLIINGGSNTLRVMKTAAHYAGNTSGLAVSSDSMAIVIGGCYSVA